MPSPSDIGPLHDQLREIYGRTVYSHKTHIIQAGMDLTQTRPHQDRPDRAGRRRPRRASSRRFFGKDILGASAFSAVCRRVLTALIAYTKDFDLGTVASEHKPTSDQLWNIREKYLDLITDLQTARYQRG